MILPLVLMLQVASVAPPLAGPISTPPLTLADVDLHSLTVPFDGYYPDQAARLGVSGQAVATCKVVKKGLLRKCAVLSATPTHQAFDLASAMLLQKNARIDPATRDGAPTAGRDLNVTVRFTSDGSRHQISFE